MESLSTLAEGLKRLREFQLAECLNPERPDLKPTPAQLEVLRDESPFVAVLGGNRAGKSQLGARIVTWFFNENHPHLSRPPQWGTGPITILVIGRVGEQIESELFAKKIKPLLIEGTYTVHRLGGVLQRVIHQNGNRMLFFSHHNVNEAREKLQAYTAAVVWLDEMADSASFINELRVRLVTTNGKLVATFTPLIRSEEVRRIIDGLAAPHGRKHVISMLDNPLIANDPARLREVIDSFKDMSDAERRTRLYGDWYIGDNAVYEFRPDKHVAHEPDYSHGWRHVVSVDPAMSGKTGLSIWAENPLTQVWWCVKAVYIDKVLSPQDLVERVEKVTARYNVVRRVADPHEVWFITAAQVGTPNCPKRTFVGVYKKHDRKNEMIKALQTALTSGQVKIMDGDETADLRNEFLNCQWSETADNKIVGASKYHLLDTAMYFVDLKPKPTEPQSVNTVERMEQELRQANKERRVRDHKRKVRIARTRKGWLR